MNSEIKKTKNIKTAENKTYRVDTGKIVPKISKMNCSGISGRFSGISGNFLFF